MSIRRSYPLCSILLLFLSSTPLTVHALALGGIGGRPAYPDPNNPLTDSWFIYTLGPGESKSDVVYLFNSSDALQRVKLYAVDSIPSNQGNFALAAEDAPRVGVGAWIELSETEVTLEPSQEYWVPFTIAIPQNADVGEHSGGIVIQRVAQEAVDLQGEVGASGATIVTRVGIRVYETVPGEIIRNVSVKDFRIERATADNGQPQFKLYLTVQNEGNISLSANANVTITGWGKVDYFSRSRLKDGLVIDLADLTDFFQGQTLSKSWQLMRGQEVTTTFEWPEPAFGRYTFQAQISYGDEGARQSVTSLPISIWVIPWTAFGVVAGIILIILLFIVFFIVRAQFQYKRWISYKVKRGDQLVTIAEEAGVAWKKLAKINKLKSPVVKTGQVLLVPPSFAKAIKAGPKEKVIQEKAKKAVQPDALYRKRRWGIVIGAGILIVVVTVVAVLFEFGARVPGKEQSATQQPDVTEAAPPPHAASIGIYDPGQEPSALTVLLADRLAKSGFRAAIVNEIPDAEAVTQETMTIFYRNNTEQALGLLEQEVLAETFYRKGLFDTIAQDLVIGVWNIDDIQWADLAARAEPYLTPSPASLSLLVLNGGAAQGAASDLVVVLKQAGYTHAEADNAPEKVTEPVVIYYQRNFKTAAEALSHVLSDAGYGNLSYRARFDQPSNIVIELGPEQMKGETEELEE